MTETDAVNQMLEVIGQLVPVDDAENSGLLEAERALVRLRQVSKEVQEKGWSFNTEKHAEFTPVNTGGLMTLEQDILKIDSGCVDIVQRGQKLFNRSKNSYAHEGAIADVTLVRLLPFVDLPSVAQTYITIKAARQFQKRFVGSSEIDGFTRGDEVDALVAMEQSEAEAGDYNYITDSRLSLSSMRGFQ